MKINIRNSSTKTVKDCEGVSKSLVSLIIKKLAGLTLVFALILIWAMYTYNESSVTTSASVLSNQKICWGIKREENNKQPDLGKVNLELIQKYEGIAMGNADKKYVYLTFDNGYEAGYTEKILDTLKENEVQATFFITAHYLNTASDLVERMIKENHIVRKSYSKS